MDKSKIAKKIYNLYLEDERVASDDALLLARYWGKDWDYQASLESNLKRLTRPETITRCRRKLINNGTIKATAQAELERYEAFKAERDEHSDQAGFIDYIERKL